MENSLSYIKSSRMKCIMSIILTIMAAHCFGQSDNNFSQETNFYSNRFKRNETYNKKIRLAKSRSLAYANTVMTLCLILSSDIPGNKQMSPICSTINKTVPINGKRTYCTVYRSITHLKCTTSIIIKNCLHQYKTRFVRFLFKVFYLFIK